MYTHIHTTNVFAVASYIYADATTCFPLPLTDNPTMAGKQDNARGAAGHTFPGAAAAVNVEMIDENGKRAFFVYTLLNKVVSRKRW